LNVEEGYWYIQDLNSQNGVKVDGQRVQRKRLDPDALITIAKHKYKILYSPKELGASGIPPAEDDAMINIWNKSLLDSAGLKSRPTNTGSRRYDPTSNKPIKVKDRTEKMKENPDE
jgi:pSer/pThr/pTyr-binding forkhead associated (FHA) protein